MAQQQLKHAELQQTLALIEEKKRLVADKRKELNEKSAEYDQLVLKNDDKKKIMKRNQQKIAELKKMINEVENDTEKTNEAIKVLQGGDDKQFIEETVTLLSQFYAQYNLKFNIILSTCMYRSSFLQNEEVGIADKLYFIGFIKDIYSFINFIDMNTLSSRSESFPYVLLEGARMKKPTISAAVGGIPDLIRDGETGLLFPSEDYKAFAEKILMLAQDKEKQEMYGEALYRLATENFSNENLARTHMGIYKAILRDFASKKEYDVALSGYYGFHNSGDDALLEAILKSLKAKKPEIRPIVFSARPKETMRQYGVDAAHRFSPVSLSRYLRKTHILINGGGSLLQDKTSSKSLWYYLYVMHLARKKGAAVYVYANGIGPLHGANCKRAARALSAAAQITATFAFPSTAAISPSHITKR